MSKTILTPALVLKSIIYAAIGFVMGFMVGVVLGVLALFVVGFSSGGSIRGAGDDVFIVMTLSIAVGTVCGPIAAYRQERGRREPRNRGR